MIRQLFTYLILTVLFVSCKKLKVNDLPDDVFLERLASIEKYSIAKGELLAYKLEITPKEEQWIANYLNDHKLEKDICEEITNKLPGVWNNIYSKFFLPRQWKRKQTSQCDITRDDIYNSTATIQLLSDWSDPIRVKNSNGYTKHLLDFHGQSNNTANTSRYRFQIAATVRALFKKPNGDDPRTFAFIDVMVDYYLQYCPDVLRCRSENDWKPVEPDSRYNPSIKEVTHAIQYEIGNYYKLEK